MEIFESDNGLVRKYIHDDHSETAIKYVSSCDTIMDPITGEFHHNSVDRKKFSVFISSSSGCIRKCKFCYLTMKNAKYKLISELSVYRNVKDAIQHELLNNPNVIGKYIKLNWMGMGESHMSSSPNKFNKDVALVSIPYVTYKLVDKLLNKDNFRCISGLDGVDVASIMSKSATEKLLQMLVRLNDDLAQFPLNPNNKKVVHTSNGYSNYTDRSIVRFFYSLHSAVNNTRRDLMPGVLSLSDTIPMLVDVSKSGPNLIFHHMFIDGLNDSDKEVNALLDLVSKYNLHDYEFRILRYNSCDNTPYKESTRFNDIIKTLSNSKVINKLKVQISTGTEIKAACGQFIVRDFHSI